LRERFGISKEDYPVFKLFKQGEKEPISFSQSVTSEDLARFVRLESGLWLGELPFDETLCYLTLLPDNFTCF
jgi:hypothetical protein